MQVCNFSIPPKRTIEGILPKCQSIQCKTRFALAICRTVSSIFFPFYLNLPALRLLYFAHDFFTASGTSLLANAGITLALVTFFTRSFHVLSTPSSCILALRLLHKGTLQGSPPARSQTEAWSRRSWNARRQRWQAAGFLFRPPHAAKCRMSCSRPRRTPSSHGEASLHASQAPSAAAKM